MWLRWKDFADGKRWKVVALAVEELIRRFLLHVLSPSFTRICYYGLRANRGHAERLAHCRGPLAGPAPAPVEPGGVAAFWLRRPERPGPDTPGALR